MKTPAEQAKKKTFRGFTLVEIMVVVLIIGVLSAIAVQNYTRARESSRRVSCVEQLKKIESAKETWAMENQKTNGTVVVWADLVGSNNYIKAQPVCPSLGTYTPNPVGTAPTCSITDHLIP